MTTLTNIVAAQLISALFRIAGPASTPHSYLFRSTSLWSSASPLPIDIQDALLMTTDRRYGPLPSRGELATERLRSRCSHQRQADIRTVCDHPISLDILLHRHLLS